MTAWNREMVEAGGLRLSVARRGSGYPLLLITGIVVGLCFTIYEMSNPVTPNAFDQPGAQIPNQLRSPWGVKNPI